MQDINLTKLEEINQVDGFNPEAFAVDYTDLSTSETRKRLPVMMQIAWFRLKYPLGKISVQVKHENDDCYVATARIYIDYKDNVDQFLAEATVSRGNCVEKPSVSAREWAQTAAIGVALRNAGFALQFTLASDEISMVDELSALSQTKSDGIVVVKPEQKALTLEDTYQAALKVPCPISKFKGKTLGDVLYLDPDALHWVATKFTGDADIQTAAKVICDYAAQITI